MSDTVSEYYVIKSIEKNNSSTFMVAVDNYKVPMREIMTREEIDLLINKIPDIETSFISDVRLRNKNQKELLRSGNSEELVKLIKSVYIRKDQADIQSKKISAADNDAFISAKKLLHDEIAFTLGITANEVPEYINNMIGKNYIAED
jgi:CarD family transcriptional regulator